MHVTPTLLGLGHPRPARQTALSPHFSSVILFRDSRGIVSFPPSSSQFHVRNVRPSSGSPLHCFHTLRAGLPNPTPALWVTPTPRSLLPMRTPPSICISDPSMPSDHHFGHSCVGTRFPALFFLISVLPFFPIPWTRIVSCLEFICRDHQTPHITPLCPLPPSDLSNVLSIC